MRHVLRAGAELKHRKNLRQGINGQPEPQHLFATAQPGAQFVQLEVGDLQGVESALVQGLSVLASAGQPGEDGGLSIAEDPLGSGSVQPFGEARQHHCDLVRGGFQTIQRSVASSAERGAAGLAAKRLDPLSATMCAIPNQRVNVGICDPEVRALLIGTGEALGVYAFGSSSPAFDLAPGPHWQRRWTRNR